MSLPPPPPRRRNAPDATLPAPPPVDRGAREARRSEEQGSARKRTLMIVSGIVVVAVIAVVAVVALGGSDEKTGPTFKASTSVDLKVGDVDVASVNPLLGSPDQFPQALKDELIARIGAYVDDGIVAPLRKGKATDQKLGNAFEVAALGRLAGADRAVVLDEGLPKAIGELKIKAPPVNMLGLSGSDGGIMLVTVLLDLKISAEAKSGIVKIHRTGTLVFAPQSTGEWRITGWTLHVDRSGAGVEVTTTSAAPTTTVAT